MHNADVAINKKIFSCLLLSTCTIRLFSNWPQMLYFQRQASALVLSLKATLLQNNDYYIQ